MMQYLILIRKNAAFDINQRTANNANHAKHKIDKFKSNSI